MSKMLAEPLSIINEELNDYEIINDRDLAEYIYDAEKIRTFGGKSLAKKRNHVNHFLREHSGHLTSRELTVNDYEKINIYLDD